MKKITEIFSYFLNEIVKKEGNRSPVWLLAFFSVLLLVFVGLYDFQDRMSNLSKERHDFSGFINTEYIEEINEVMEDGYENFSAIDGFFEENNWDIVAEKYIIDNNPLENEEFSSLALDDIYKNEEGLTVLKYKHYYKNLEVSDSEFLVYFDDLGEFVSYEDSLKRDIGLDVNPLFSAKGAYDVFIQDSENQGFVFKEGKLMVYCSDECFLVWDISFQNNVGEENVVSIDAKNGLLLE